MAQPNPEDSLAAYAAVQRAADREILAELRAAFKDTTRQLALLARQGNKDLERQRILAVRKAMLEAQAQFYERAGNVIQRRRVEAAARAIQVSGRYDEAVFRRAGREEDLRAVSESLEETEATAPEALIARLSPDGTRQNLSSRVYRTRAYTEGLLERRINSALARGLTAQEFAREVQDLVNPNTPGGVRFAALRLARTEINNAYHAMAIRAAEMKPWVVGMEWHTSGSHTRPDECDKLRGEVFKPAADTPPKPHPQCLCYVTPVVGGDNGEAGDDAFLDDLVNGLFDDFIEDNGGRPAEREPEPIPVSAPNVASLPEPTQDSLRGKAALDSVRTGLIRRGSLTAKQRKAWKEYESSFFVSINNYFRRGRKDIDGKQDPFVERIANEMDATFQPLDQDTEVFRGLYRARRQFGDALGNDMTGVEWTEEGYSSTSVDEQVSRDFALSADSAEGERIVMRTRVRRGVGGSAVSHARADGGQGEIALQRKTGWRITRDLGVDPAGIRYLEAEVFLP